MKPPSQPPEAKPEMPQGRDERPRPLESATLLGAREEVLISHDGETYRLRRTRQGKLILTK
jgi:hemin uptake protein HemP